MTSRQVQRFHEEAGARLHELSCMLLPGAKLTLLVRRPDARDGSQDMVITDDELSEAIRALEIRKEAKAPEGEPAARPCGCPYQYPCDCPSTVLPPGDRE